MADHTCSMPFTTCAVARLTGAFGGILNSTQSFLGVIFAHFLYGKADRMTPAKTLGLRAWALRACSSARWATTAAAAALASSAMLLATVVFTLSGPWNKSVTRKADSFAVCFLNLFVGGAALFLLGTALGGRLAICEARSALVVMLYLAFICGAGYLLWALLMKNNPVSRICHLRLREPGGQRAAERRAQRRGPVPLAVSGGTGASSASASGW